MQGARRSAKPGARVHRRSEPNSGAPRGSTRRPSKRRRPHRLKRWVARHPWLSRGIRFSLLAAIWGGIVLGAAIVYFIASVPDPVIAALDDRPPNVTILAQDGTVLAERGLRRGHVRLDSLPPYLVQAVLSTEDRRFYAHFGIDPLGLVLPQKPIVDEDTDQFFFDRLVNQRRGDGRIDAAGHCDSDPHARFSTICRATTSASSPTP